MRFFIFGPRMFGGLIRPGVSFSPRRYRGGPYAAAPAMAPEAPAGFVYVIRGSGDHRKVGVSNEPQRRLAELQTGSSSPLTMEFCGPVYGRSAYSVEMEAHAILAPHRLSGEWFETPFNVAVAAIYAAAERAGASMQPQASAAPEAEVTPAFGLSGWWKAQGTLVRVFALAAVGASIDTLAMPVGSPFLLIWLVVGGVLIAFT